jgi:hypothetical protein
MLYKLIIVCFLFLYLTGCDILCSCIVDPNVLDFGETEDEFYFKLTANEYCGEWDIYKSESWVSTSPDWGKGVEIIAVHVSRNGLDPGEYSGVLEIEILKSGTVAATVTVKMTVPGDDDYTTTTTELPTTTTTIPVSTSTTTEPITTSTTTSLFVGDPPILHSISFPGEIMADGEGNSGTVSFSDPDGDIVRAYFKLVSGYGFSSFDLDPMESLQEGDATDGTFGFSLWCTGSTRYIELEVTLKDQADNMSNAETFGFTCTEEE